ncbi:MAG: DEAD/DEAH box helicase [FCB group bacterium]|jgi:ATP-dependent Lhr-like helicase|nr:DEAD/DEAH box helicase [FCB group bacterium]
MSESSAFDRLHPLLREQLYGMRWTQLRTIQVEAIHAILGGTGHLIVSANTAGGKTEAAFLPVLSRVLEEPRAGLRAVYVGPLKALINDQFRRLEDLCASAEIPVHKWHGDVGRDKKKLLQDPSGVLLITPESIESLFINHPYRLDTLFSALSFIVIDELHAFIGSERGAHLKSLLARVSQKAKEPPRLVGLSATLGDVALAARWLCPRETEQVRIVSDSADKVIKYIVKGYLRAGHNDSPEDTAEAPSETEADCALADDLIRVFSGKTALIFANNKTRLEFYADLVARTCQRLNRPDGFRIHHGSLSKAEREDTEEALRSSVPTATFCSATLELGIDVGNVAAVGHIGAPWSVNSLAQRLGRSGRRDGEASVMYVHIQEDEPTSRTVLVERLFPDLLQAVAMTELLLEKWCEPPDWDRLHLSTLVQQILSVVAETGGARAQTLFERLVERGAFMDVPRDVFLRVLRDLGAADLLEQTPEGDLILGLEGERTVRSVDFYSAFTTPEEYKVVCAGHNIGTVTMDPGMGADGFLILAGRRWRIVEVDNDRQEILVEPAKGGRLPYFSGAGGRDLHPRVREKMREVLGSELLPAYLNPKAKEMLQASRAVARELGLPAQVFVRDGVDTWWFTWTGSRINRTLAALGKHFAKLDVRDEGIALVFEKATEADIRRAYLEFAEHCPSAEDIAARIPVRVTEKYDAFLSDDLQCLLYARNCLDTSGAVSTIAAALRS